MGLENSALACSHVLQGIDLIGKFFQSSICREVKAGRGSLVKVVALVLNFTGGGGCLEGKKVLGFE